MKQSAEKYLIEKIQEMHTVIACSDEEQASLLRAKLEAYIDALVEVRRNEFESVRVVPTSNCTWNAIIGESKFFIRKIAYAGQYEGYESYYQHPTSPDYIKPLGKELQPSLDAAIDLIQKEYRGGLA